MTPQSLITDGDVYLFNEGTHARLYDKLGNHPVAGGTHFAVWAPEAASVSVMGSWNGWSKDAHPLGRRGGSGIWEGFVPGVGPGAIYKYHVVSRHHGYAADKADPFATLHQVPPQTASVVWAPEHAWGDAAWMEDRKAKSSLGAPISIYEVHLGSWRRVPDEGNRPLSYLELARELPAYVARLGFTHVELLPVMEHPFYGSWGYQITGYFAPTARYGKPEDLMALIDALHQQGIGVILDWVPSHFPTDEHGLGYFDGTHLFEHADPRQGFHPDWKSSIFNYGRHEVRSFLLSNATYWLDRFHVDGLRVDAVASMLYLDYSRKEGEWIPNQYGGRENLEAIQFLQRMNQDVYGSHPDVVTIAEESTAWPLVSRPVYLGGLGFGMKWDMGWMHDTLAYFGNDPIHRKYHHDKLTFRMIYAFSENYVLPLSHDEVVHGKGSLYGRMPGDPWRKRANLRLLYGYMYGQPGKKLLFMGGELGQEREWNHDTSLDWHLVEDQGHAGIQRWVAALNRLLREEPALAELDSQPGGFEWIDCSDVEQSVLVFLRKARASRRQVVVVCNFTPIPRYGYGVGVPHEGPWREALSSDAVEFGGSGVHAGLPQDGRAEAASCHGRSHCLRLTLPPLGALFLVGEAPG